MLRLATALVAGVLVGASLEPATTQGAAATSSAKSPAESAAAPIRLGNFSVSLTVKDLAKSREFYEKLGFKVIQGDGKVWQILQNETATIGLFQGLFPRNTFTFNPGWTRDMKTLPAFDDVRALQRTLRERGLEPANAADEAGTGPASFTLTDPDGNPILIDQHVNKPAK